MPLSDDCAHQAQDYVSEPTAAGQFSLSSGLAAQMLSPIAGSAPSSPPASPHESPPPPPGSVEHAEPLPEHHLDLEVRELAELINVELEELELNDDVDSDLMASLRKLDPEHWNPERLHACSVESFPRRIETRQLDDMQNVEMRNAQMVCIVRRVNWEVDITIQHLVLTLCCCPAITT